MARRFLRISNEQWLKDTHDIPPQVSATLWYDELVLPTRATRHAAGYDIISPWSFILLPGEDIKIPTGFKVEMEPSDVMLIFPRSGLGFKNFARLANTIGVGDADYFNNEGNEGHYFVKLRNEGLETLAIGRGKAFAQAIFLSYGLVDEDGYGMGAIRTGGLGSTDKP